MTDGIYQVRGQIYRTTLRNGTLIPQENPPPRQPDLTLTLNRTELLELLAGRGVNGMTHEGDPDALERLGVLAEPDPNLPIVTP